MFEQSTAEIASNVYDHSFSPLGAYIFSKYDKLKNTIETTVSDIGVGIPFSINKYFRTKGVKYVSDQESLSKALQQNFTTETTPSNRGKGLDTVRSFIKQNRGIFRIYSGKAFYSLRDDGKEEITENPINYFKGTIVNFKIEVKNLNDIENEEEISDIW